MNDQSAKVKHLSKTYVFGKTAREGIAEGNPFADTSTLVMFDDEQLADVQYVCRQIIRGKDGSWKSMRGTALLRHILRRMVQLQNKRERRNGPCRTVGYDIYSQAIPLDERLDREAYACSYRATVPPLIAPSMDAKCAREERDQELGDGVVFVCEMIRRVLSVFGVPTARVRLRGRPRPRSFDEAIVARVQHEWEARAIDRGAGVMFADDMEVAD